VLLGQEGLQMRLRLHPESSLGRIEFATVVDGSGLSLRGIPALPRSR